MDIDKSIIDWNHCMLLAGNQTKLAQDILLYLVKNLPGEVDNLKTLLLSKNYSKARQALHKLHGALSYCGVPRLKTAVLTLDQSLKSEEFNEQLVFELETEAEKVILLANTLGVKDE